MAGDPITDPILTGEASRILHCGEDTTRRYGDERRLTVIRSGTRGIRIYDRAEVERLARELQQRRPE
jgi:DNA-binding transcriptional MerR regulator